MLKNKTIKDFSKMIDNLEKTLKMNKDEVIRDSAIKRFELCFDLAWKVIKNYAKIQGLECYSPRECFKNAYQLKLIDSDGKWIKMIEDRNLCVHFYDENWAEEVYDNLNDYLEMFKELLNKIKK